MDPDSAVLAATNSHSTPKRKRNPDVPRKKTGNACLRCRDKKTKCSGDVPCINCTRHSHECVFPEDVKRVRVAEKYLQELENAAIKQSSVVKPSQDGTPRPQYIAEETVPEVSNPLTGSKSFFLMDSAGKQRHLGSSSSWSFSWQVRNFLKAVVGDDSVNLIPSSEQDTYQIASASGRSMFPLTTDAYPPADYAEHLITTVLFHLGAVYHLFDKDAFMARLMRFYAAPDGMRELYSLWNVQFLLVIALGKMFLGKGSSEFGPPGAADFLRALSMKRDILEYHDDPQLSIEIHCLRALYLFTADMRNAAYATIGQALRLALSIGMNREPPATSMTSAQLLHRRRLWWTVYIIDRKLSINLGAPLSIQDSDIDLKLPAVRGHTDPNAALWLHARLAILEGQVMTAAFKINSKIDRAFIAGIEDVFTSMAKLSEEFLGSFNFALSDPSSISRTASTLHIMYYQCTIMLTRPIMFSLCQQRLANGLQSASSDRIASDAMVAILQTCIGAASTNLKILSILHDQDLLEPFLPFDLQAAFAAAFILLLSTIAYPALAIDLDCVRTAEIILDWMISKGNKPAESRKRDLTELRKMASRITGISSTVQDTSVAAAPADSSNWLWNALDIGYDSQNLQTGMTDFDLLGNNALENTPFGSSLGEEWFWAGPSPWLPEEGKN